MRLHPPVACALLLAAASTVFADNAIFDTNGRLSYLLYGGDELAVRSRFSPGPGRGERLRITHEGPATVWSGEFFRQTVTVEGATTHLVLEIKPGAELKDGHTRYWLELPRDVFSGGTAAAGEKSVGFVLQKPAGREILQAQARSLRLRTKAGVELTLAFDRPLDIRLEDRWDRNGRYYSAAIEFQERLEAALQVSGKADEAPAHLRLSARDRRYKFSGFGGNYCFGIESPVTNYTLQNLRVAWARTEMSLVDWAPENDKPDSRLRHEFELMQQLNRLGIPYVISIWQIPEQLYSDPGPKPHRQEKRLVPAEKWPALVEAIGSYLAYAKEHYQGEPDLFSFNEANIGIDVLLTPEEHRDAIKRIGADLAKRGLKTRMLLADATGPRGTHEYALAAANDPDAMRYVGAVGFHSWGGGTPDQYRAWGDVAEWLGLPLLVTELGVDAAAHRGRMYDSFQYGIQEVRMYQELLLYARPQGTIQWEFTGDYGMVKEDLQPTQRFWFVKQFSNLTPKNADALGTASDHPKVLFTAFAGAAGDLALHVANLGAGREISIEGLPAGLRALKAVVTSETDSYRELEPLTVESGTVRLRVPAQSLVTLLGQSQNF
jgi:hypothetical protein